MWEKFAELVKGGKPDPFWPQVAMLTQVCVLSTRHTLVSPLLHLSHSTQVVSDALFESAKTNTKISLQGSQSKK